LYGAPRCEISAYRQAVDHIVVDHVQRLSRGERMRRRHFLLFFSAKRLATRRRRAKREYSQILIFLQDHPTENPARINPTLLRPTPETMQTTKEMQHRHEKRLEKQKQKRKEKVCRRTESVRTAPPQAAVSNMSTRTLQLAARGGVPTSRKTLVVHAGVASSPRDHHRLAARATVALFTCCDAAATAASPLRWPRGRLSTAMQCGLA